MKHFAHWLLIALLAIASPQKAPADEYDALLRDFDARLLTQDDKRFLQAALAFEGVYNGLLDGAWGTISQRALEKYSRREFGTESQDWHMAMLALAFADRLEVDGWNLHYFESINMSVMLPMKTLITDPASDSFVNFRHSRSSLAISVGRLSRRSAQNVHDFTIKQHRPSNKPYSVRKPNFAVSSGTKADGSTLYTRSNLLNGAWSTIMVSANRRDKALLNAVTASIATGRASKIDVTRGGHLERTIRKALSLAADIEAQTSKSTEKNRNPEPPTRAVTSNGTSSGTGFFVSEAGHVLTNAHVVSECHTITVDGSNARLLVSSDDFDLAILQTPKPQSKKVAVFSASPARLNSDVTAIGYPYVGLLGGLNVTRGSVSSLKGLRGDATTMQISAPVQSGNSGGPLLGADGEVVGVVVAKLNAKKVADTLGDVPQNVNFAVRGEIAKLFLAQNGVDPILGLADDIVRPEAIAEIASSFTVYIECEH